MPRIAPTIRRCSSRPGTRSRPRWSRRSARWRDRECCSSSQPAGLTPPARVCCMRWKRSTCCAVDGRKPFVGVLAGLQIGRLAARQIVAHVDDRLHRRPRQTRDLGQDHHALGAGFDHHVLGDRHRHIGERRDRGVGFVELAGFGKCRHLEFVEPAVLVERFDERVGDRRVRRDGRRARSARVASPPAPRSGLPGLLRVGGLEPPPHGLRGLRDQFKVEMPRNGRTQADAGREIVVALGAIDQPGEAALGEFRAGIVDGALDHLVIAAQHQHVGDRAAQASCASRSPSNAPGSCCARSRSAFRRRAASDCDSTGPATSIESSNASARMVQRRRGVDRGQAVGEQRLGRGFDVIASGTGRRRRTARSARRNSPPRR